MKHNPDIANAHEVTILTIAFYRIESLADDDGETEECWTASIVSNEQVKVTGSPSWSKSLALGNLFSDLAFYAEELNFFFNTTDFVI
jgi:hypothetical protein